MEMDPHHLLGVNGARNEPGSVTGRYGPGWPGTSPFGVHPLPTVIHQVTPPVTRILKWFMYSLSLEDPPSPVGDVEVSDDLYRDGADRQTIKGAHFRGNAMGKAGTGVEEKRRVQESPRLRLHPRFDDGPDPFRHFPDVLGLDVDFTGPGDLGHQSFAGEQGFFESAELPDHVLAAVRECDEVEVVDDQLLAGGKDMLVDGTERVDEEQS